MISLHNFSLSFPSVKNGPAEFFKSERPVEILKNINLNFRKNERVGLLGRNGAGKTTLLRAIAQVYQPTSGDMALNGHVSTFFEIGTGVDVDATGLQNIKRLMCVRGIALEHFEDVVSYVEKFTELGELLPRPVKTYSQGQKMRLSIGVALFNLNEIVLFDEMIGLGDKHFTRKVRDELIAKLKSSSVFVIASHSENILRQFCERGIVLENGTVAFDGTVVEAIQYFNTGR